MRRMVVLAALAATLLTASPAAASSAMHVKPTGTPDARGCYGLDVWDGDQLVTTLPADDGYDATRTYVNCAYNDWWAALPNGRLVFDWVRWEPSFNFDHFFTHTWGSDGTVHGTVELKMGYTDCGPTYTMVDRTVFIATVCPYDWPSPAQRPHVPVLPFGYALLATRGSPGSTFALRGVHPGAGPASNGERDWPRFATVGKLIVYVAGGEHKGRELWVSDGTRKGSHLLKDIRPGYDVGSRIGDLVSDGTIATFMASDEQGRARWVTDGTWKGTHKAP